MLATPLPASPLLSSPRPFCESGGARPARGNDTLAPPPEPTRPNRAAGVQASACRLGLRQSSHSRSPPDPTPIVLRVPCSCAFSPIAVSSAAWSLGVCGRGWVDGWTGRMHGTPGLGTSPATGRATTPTSTPKCSRARSGNGAWRAGPGRAGHRGQTRQGPCLVFFCRHLHTQFFILSRLCCLPRNFWVFFGCVVRDAPRRPAVLCLASWVHSKLPV